MEIKKYRNYWALYDEGGEIICVTIYKKGAIEVKKRIEKLLNQIGKADESTVLTG